MDDYAQKGKRMCDKQQRKMEEYQLRSAAGKYWLLHMEQKGIPYERPLQLNVIGAEMWRLIRAGKTTGQIVEYLAREYDAPEEEVQEDVEQFYQQLENYGILIEG